MDKQNQHRRTPITTPGDVPATPQSGTTYTVTSKKGAEVADFTQAGQAAQAFHDADAHDAPYVVASTGRYASVIASTVKFGDAPRSKSVGLGVTDGGAFNHAYRMLVQDALKDRVLRQGSIPDAGVHSEKTTEKNQQSDPVPDARAVPKTGPNATGTGNKEIPAQQMNSSTPDRADAQQASAPNTVEAVTVRKQRDSDKDAQRTMQSQRVAIKQEKKTADNQVESDVVITARKAVSQIIPAEVERQYLRVGDQFYQARRPEVVAFVDKGNKLETTSNNENISESMIRIAQARGWDAIKVSGSEKFRREAWLEAASRGIRVKGYTPSEQDKATLAKRTPANAVPQENSPFHVREKGIPHASGNVQPKRDRDARTVSFVNEAPEVAVQKYPELAGAYAVLAAIDKQAQADGFTQQQRSIIAARTREHVVNNIERGQMPAMHIKETADMKQERRRDRDHGR